MSLGSHHAKSSQEGAPAAKVANDVHGLGALEFTARRIIAGPGHALPCPFEVESRVGSVSAHKVAEALPKMLFHRTARSAFLPTSGTIETNSKTQIVVVAAAAFANHGSPNGWRGREGALRLQVPGTHPRPGFDEGRVIVWLCRIGLCPATPPLIKAGLSLPPECLIDEAAERFSP